MAQTSLMSEDSTPSARAGGIVHIVDNAVTVDGRVLKAVDTCVRHGIPVAVLGRSLNGERQSITGINDCPVQLLPIGTKSRDQARLKARGFFSSIRYRVLYGALIQVIGSKHRNSPDAVRTKINTIVRCQRHRRSQYLALIGDLTRFDNSLSAVARQLARILWVSYRAQNAFKLRLLKAFQSPPKRGQKEDQLSKKDRLLERFFPNCFWRLNDPWVKDWFEPMLVELRALSPETIHAHDVRGLAIACMYKREISSTKTRTPPRIVADVHEWWPGVSWASERQRLAMTRVQDEFLPEADAVLTVSSTLADMIYERYSMKAEVVPNFPNTPSSSAKVPSIRSRAFGLRSGDILAVYSGSLAPARGVEQVIEALSHFPTLHLSLVAAGPTTYLNHLKKCAVKHKVRHRLHIHPYVSPQELLSYLRGADFSLIPFHRALNHEISLPSKFAEYILAGLPIVSTKYGEVGDSVEKLSVGLTFDPDDPDTLRHTIKRMLSELAELKISVRNLSIEIRNELTWERYDKVLIDAYSLN